MGGIILVIHFIACFLLIVSILLQSGKGGAAGVFSGTSSDAVFSASSGSSFIKKFTLTLALVVALTSIMLTVSHNRSGFSSVVDKYAAQPVPGQQPAAPAAATAAQPATDGKTAPAANAAKAEPAKTEAAKPAAKAPSAPAAPVKK